jgi:hypothetical protein
LSTTESPKAQPTELTASKLGDRTYWATVHHCSSDPPNSPLPTTPLRTRFWQKKTGTEFLLPVSPFAP